MRPRHEHKCNLDAYGDKRNGYSGETQDDRATIVPFDSDHNCKFEVVTLLDLIRLSHLARQGGEKCSESLCDLTTAYDEYEAKLLCYYYFVAQHNLCC